MRAERILQAYFALPKAEIRSLVFSLAAVLSALMVPNSAWAQSTCSVTITNGVETSGSGNANICGGATYFTATYSAALNFNPATVTTNQVNAFSTEIVGNLNGGTVLYDKSFAAAYGTPTVQAGVNSAIAAITTAGGPGVVIMNPKLVSHTVNTSSASSSVYTVSNVSTAQNVTTTIGPGTANALHYATAFVHDGGTGYDVTVTNPDQLPALPNVYTVCAPSIYSVSNGTINTPAAGTVLNAKPACTANNGGATTLAGGQVDINLASTTTLTIDTATSETDTTTTAEVYDVNGLSVQNIGTVHDAITDAGFTAGDRFARRLLNVGQGDGVDAFGSSTLRMWGEAYGYAAVIGHEGSAPGYSNVTGGLRGGLSYQADDNFQIGAGLDYNGGTLDENVAHEFANLHLVQAGLNAGWHQDNLFATLAGSYGWATASAQVTPQGVNATALSQYGFHIASVAGEAGMRFDLGDGFGLTPLLGVAYYNIAQGGFTETGSLLALTAASHGFERTKEWLGLKGDTDIGVAGTVLTFGAYGRAIFWGGDTTITLPVAFASSSTMLSLTGPSAGKAGGEAGASVGWKAFDAVSFYANYDAQFRARTALQTLAIGLHISL